MRVVQLCQLENDFAMLKNKDQTLAELNGTNLSGGQQQRIALARAVYQDADIYLLDDPFSALDVKVRTLIFNQLILGELKHKTILMVTHQPEIIQKADTVIFMDDGRIQD